MPENYRQMFADADPNPASYRSLTKRLLKELFDCDIIPKIHDPAEEFMMDNHEGFNYPYNSKAQWIKVFTIIKRSYAHNKHVAELHRELGVDSRICPCCGIVVTSLPAKDDAGTSICNTCSKRYFVNCHLCGKVHLKMGSATVEGKRVCYHCFTQNYHYCASCRRPLLYGTGTNVSRDWGHRNEVKHLAIYKKHPKFHRVERRWVYDELDFSHVIDIPTVELCDNCIITAYAHCEHCGKRFPKRGMMRLGVERWCCQDCAELEQIIKRYDFACVPRLLTNINEPTRTEDGLFYGVEIEMEYRKKAYNLQHEGRKIIEWWGQNELYIKHDGSLEHGFEVVSHPFTWGHFMDFRDKWSDFLMMIKERGWSGTYFSIKKNRYTCSVHIHMSKKAFTRMHLFKFVHFFYKTSTRALIIGIAGRKSDKYARFEPADFKRATAVGKDKKNISRRRYSALNLMGGHAHEKGHAPPECQTVEVRVFDGTLEPFTFFMYLEFLQSLYEFTLYYSPRDMLVRKYIEFLAKNADSFRVLTNFLVYNKELCKRYSFIKPILKGV